MTKVLRIVDDQLSRLTCFRYIETFHRLCEIRSSFFRASAKLVDFRGVWAHIIKHALFSFERNSYWRTLEYAHTCDCGMGKTIMNNVSSWRKGRGIRPVMHGVMRKCGLDSDSDGYKNLVLGRFQNRVFLFGPDTRAGGTTAGACEPGGHGTMWPHGLARPVLVRPPEASIALESKSGYASTAIRVTGPRTEIEAYGERGRC